MALVTEELLEQFEEAAATAPPLAALPGELGPSGGELMQGMPVLLLAFGCLALVTCLPVEELEEAGGKLGDLGHVGGYTGGLGHVKTLKELGDSRW